MLDLLQIVLNLADLSDKVLTYVIWPLCYFLALFYFYKFIMKMMGRSQGGPNLASTRAIFYTLGVSIAFGMMPTLLSMFGMTAFGSIENNPEAIFAHAPNTIGIFAEDSVGRPYVVAIATIVRAFGAVFFIRGWIGLQKSSEPNGPDPAAGWVRIGAGVCAFFLPPFLEALESIGT